MCSLLENVLLGYALDGLHVGDMGCVSVVMIIWCCEVEFDALVLENLILVQSLINVFAAGECVARIYCECSFAGDTASSVVVVMI